MRTALPLLAFVALNVVACSGGGIVGSRDPDAAGEPPDGGGCAKGFVACGAECLVACPSPDGDAAPSTDAGHGDASSAEAAPGDAPSGDAPSTTDAVPPADASDGATPTYYNLYVTFTGWPVATPIDVHEFAEDTTTGNSWAACGGGGWGGTKTLVTNTLIAGHSYAYDYWFDTSTFTFCSAGPYNPTYYVHAFGPVIGDTYITVTPADPLHK